MAASRSSSVSSLGHAGSRILGSQAASFGTLPVGNRRDTPEFSVNVDCHEDFNIPSAPPSVTQRGKLYSDTSCPKLAPYTKPAQNVVSMHHAHMQRLTKQPGEFQQNLWSDSMKHLGEQEWPAHSVPLFVFCGRDRPRPGYREEVCFTLSEDQYVNFALRLRCGSGDRHMGGTVGIVHSSDRSEALPGTEGQLVTITNLIVNPNNTVFVEAVGDLGFRVRRSWMPRGLRGMQCAIVDVVNEVPRLDTILEACESDANLLQFAQLVRRVPSLSEKLSGEGSFTVFVPVNMLNVEALVMRPDLEAQLQCYICPERVAREALYTGRTLRALDGTPLNVAFLRAPKSDPCVNKVPIEHLDIFCCNGVIHTITGPLTPAPRPHGRRTGVH